MGNILEEILQESHTPRQKINFINIPDYLFIVSESNSSKAFEKRRLSLCNSGQYCRKRAGKTGSGAFSAEVRISGDYR
jgi:hypothetical protein